MPPLRPLFGLLLLIVLVAGCGPARTGPGAVDADAPQAFTTTESGLKYKVLRRGNGDFPGPDSRVTVDYRGWLDNGKTFDQSYDAHDPITFSLAGVVKGWTEGMQKIDKGGMIELEIPPDLAYGANGSGGVPPNATLHFRVELHDFD